MKLSKLLICCAVLIVLYFVVDYIVSKHNHVKIEYIQELEQIYNKEKFSSGDTIALCGSELFVANEQENVFYFYDDDGRNVYVRDREIENYLCKNEFYIVENYRWKSKTDIDQEIALFNSTTISLDSVRKYSAGYQRFFMLAKGNMSKNYHYSGKGDFIGSSDYDDTIENIYEWKIIIKEEGDIFDGEIGDSILIDGKLRFGQLNDKQKVDSILKH